MNKKIESLTEEQKALFPKYVDKWLKIGLSTTPANRPKAEKLIGEVYKIAGLTPPKTIVWCGSPLSAILTAKIVDQVLQDKELMKRIKKTIGKGAAKPPKNIGASVWDSVRASVWASVWASVRDSVGASVGASVWDSVRDSVWASVRDSVRDSVRASVRDSVRDSVGASVWASVRNEYGYAVWNQHDAGWYAFCEYFYEVLNLSKQVEKQIPLMRLSEEANWMYPYKNFCFVSEKPEICELRNGRIHSENGPAVKYRDGFSVYAIEGVRMPDWVIETPADELDAEKVMAISNVEQRLMAIKKVGIGRVLSKLKSKVISEGALDDSGLIYKLHEVELAGSKEKLFEMQNPSEPKKHYEWVVPECETIFHADMWRRGHDDFKTAKYQPTELRA